MNGFITRLAKSQRGSAIVEFAFLAPVICGLLLGVLQVGSSMHSYNALRGLSSDVERYAVVNYQNKNKLSNSQLTSYARSIAISAPYDLKDANFKVDLVTAGTQRVTGATELTFTATYTVESVLRVIGIPAFDINFTRSIFLLNS